MILKIMKKELLEFKNDIGSTLLIVIMAIAMIAGMMVFFAYDFSKSTSESTYTAYIESTDEDLSNFLNESTSFSIVDDAEEADIKLTKNANGLDIQFDSNDFTSTKAAEILNQIVESYNHQLLIAELDQNDIKKPDTYINTSTTDTKDINEKVMSVGDAIVKVLLPMAILFFVPLIIMTPASSIIATEKDSKTLESTLLLPVSRKETIIAKFLSVVAIGLVSLLLIIATFVITSIAIKSFFDVDVSLTAIDYIEIFIIGLSFLLPVGAAGIALSLVAKNVKNGQIIGTVVFFMFAGLTQLAGLLKDVSIIKYLPIVNNGLVINQIANFDQNLDSLNLVLALVLNLVMAYIFIQKATNLIKNEKYILPR